MALRNLLTGVAAAALLSLPVAQPGNLPLGAAAVQAQEKNVSINVFFDTLSDQGEWVKHPTYRYVWVPSNVSSDWAPYTHGHWAHTDRFGWTFVSDEPFAWAVYHYGRWGYDPDIGWFWVPGTTWAPAWVSWRRGHDTVGWAPLPPEGEGFAVTTQISSQEPPRGYWHFVRAREFLKPDLATVIIRDETPYEETQVVGPVEVQNNVVVNNVIDVDFIRQESGQEVKTTKVQVVNDPIQARQAARQGTVVAFEGQLAKPSNDVAPTKAVEPKQVKAPTVGQNIETTGSIQRGQQKLPNEQPSGTGQATGGQRAGGNATTGNQAGTEQPNATAPGQATNQEKSAKGTTGEENGGALTNKKIEEQNKSAKGATGQENNATASTKKLEEQNKAAKGATGEENGATASTKKLEGQNKTAKGATGQEQSGSAKSNGTAEEQGQARQEQSKTKRKIEQGAGETQSGQAPAAKSDQGGQAQGTTEENGAAKSAQKKLKKQPAEGNQGAQNLEKSNKGAAADQSQAEGQGPREAQSAPGKGPRKLQQSPSEETTGAISGGKRNGAQGGAEHSMKPEGAAPGAQGKTKGCSTDQSAGNC
ncbi:DUF6600 domain-containing protein [Mesorhizobium sp. BAC0120]|uniref:DUF6600 domain-containing protein n=1 Tax=Mesorhizobium sp. BAC0120 TaxID=3090670 RepID=UPI00298BDBE1|nr:DUF6600 domain-containing protein [Mesorhizobium sp. BAC0120]MDW6024072.1 DUF6600 domain-containing protein [Mesorhizobium sp. BAC0120]